MKKALPGLALLATLFGCSKKSDDNTTPELPTDKYIVTRLTKGNDSLVLKYDGEGRVIKFADWTGNVADSFEVSYSEKGLAEFKYFAFTGKRTDRKFIYEGDNLKAIDYYNMDINGQLIVTDKDSLVYKNGRLSEYHEILGGVRSTVYKLTWLGENVEKVEFFLVNGDIEMPVSVNTYAYSDKTGYQHTFRAEFLSRYQNLDFSHLSAKELVKDEQKAAGTGVELYTSTYTTSYNENGYPKERKEVTVDKQVNETRTITTKIEYAVLP